MLRLYKEILSCRNTKTATTGADYQNSLQQPLQILQQKLWEILNTIRGVFATELEISEPKSSNIVSIISLNCIQNLNNPWNQLSTDGKIIHRRTIHDLC